MSVCAVFKFTLSFLIGLTTSLTFAGASLPTFSTSVSRSEINLANDFFSSSMVFLVCIPFASFLTAITASLLALSVKVKIVVLSGFGGLIESSISFSLNLPVSFSGNFVLAVLLKLANVFKPWLIVPLFLLHSYMR